MCKLRARHHGGAAARPWHIRPAITWAWQRAKGEIYEYACHEGNYSLRGMLSGARADEAAAAR